MCYFTDENLLFTGDTVLEDVTGPTYRPTGSDQDMKDSVKQFKTLAMREIHRCIPVTEMRQPMNIY